MPADARSNVSPHAGTSHAWETLEFLRPVAVGHVELRVPELGQLSALCRFMTKAAETRAAVEDIVTVTGLERAVIDEELQVLTDKRVLRAQEGRLTLVDPLGTALLKRLTAAERVRAEAPRVQVDLFEGAWRWVSPGDSQMLNPETGRMLPARVFRPALANPNVAELIELLLRRYPELDPADLHEGHVEAVLHVDASGVVPCLVSASVLVLPLPGWLLSGAAVEPPPAEPGGVWFQRWVTPCRVELGDGRAVSLALDRATGTVHRWETLEPLLGVTAREVPRGTLALASTFHPATLAAALDRGSLTSATRQSSGLPVRWTLEPSRRLFCRSRVEFSREGEDVE